jgi:hypothetical protein
MSNILILKINKPNPIWNKININCIIIKIIHFLIITKMNKIIFFKIKSSQKKLAKKIINI